MDIKKWFIRIGSMLILLGFILPSVLVSCAGAPQTGQTFSLLDLSSDSQMGMQLLFLVPLGALLTLVLAFLPASLSLNRVSLLLGELGGIGVGILSALVTLMMLSSDLQQYGLTISPAYGLFILIAGYALASIGVALYFPEFFGGLRSPARSSAPGYQAPTIMPQPQLSPPSSPGYPSQYSGPVAQSTAHLQLMRGNASQSQYFLQDNFTIGRGSQNQIQVPGDTVSRQHARLRYAQGGWFIQDQDSLTGTFVNGERVSATRLNPGDTVTIGETVLRFNQ